MNSRWYAIRIGDQCRNYEITSTIPINIQSVPLEQLENDSDYYYGFQFNVVSDVEVLPHIHVETYGFSFETQQLAIAACSDPVFVYHLSQFLSSRYARPDGVYVGYQNESSIPWTTYHSIVLDPSESHNPFAVQERLIAWASSLEKCNGE